MIVSQILGSWYDSNKRLLPWRESRNPYYIWLSEIILQQTRVKQGLSYYYRFVENFPTLKDLAAAETDEILLLWQGLGYYTRARNLHKTAKLLIEKYDGNFPEAYKQLLELPGIGEYTGGAIASLAFNIPVISIDGNVQRVLARLFGLSASPHSASGKKLFRNAAESILDTNNPGRHNQAMIELGALVCLSAKPKCSECPINDHCYAYKMNQVELFPRRQKKKQAMNRYFYYMVISKSGKILMRQRDDNDIWARLYDFPLIETDTITSFDHLIGLDEWKKVLGSSLITIKGISPRYKHILSHQILNVWFIEIEVEQFVLLGSIRPIDMEKISQYPVPRLIEKYLDERKKKNNNGILTGDRGPGKYI
jgi:A/G-specific adenine glycosylase